MDVEFNKSIFPEVQSVPQGRQTQRRPETRVTIKLVYMQEPIRAAEKGAIQSLAAEKDATQNVYRVEKDPLGTEKGPIDVVNSENRAEIGL